MADDAPTFAVNAGTETIPAFAVVEPDGSADAGGRVGVRKCTRANGSAVFFNGPLAVVAGGFFGALPPSPTAVAGLDPLDLPLAAGAQLGTRPGQWFLKPGQTGFRAVAPPTLGAVLVAFEPAAAAAGFYASLTGSGSPYSFAEVAGPAVGSAAVAGGRTGTANAYEQLTSLNGIPSGTVVWATAGTVAQPYRFACVKIVYVTAWQINTGTPCTISPSATTTYYVSSASLCGRAV